MSPAMFRWLGLSALTLGLALFATPAAALLIHVPGDHPTIQAGINAAQTGDQVLVAPGTYSGVGNFDLDFLGKNIVVVSEGGPAVTTIDVQSMGCGFFVQSDLPPTARVEGFSIINGGNWGILIFESSLTIRNCIIRGNVPGGISAFDSNPGTPVQIATIEDCIVSANTGNGLRLVGHRVQASRCTFEDNTFRGLHHLGGGGPLGPAGIGTYTDCIIRRNTQGGILFSEFGGGTFIRCEITDHTTASGGAGVRHESEDSGSVFENCLFARNHSTNGSGGGAMTHVGSQFTGCRFEENSARNGGGLSYGFSLGNSPPAAPVSGCQFVNNMATESAGGLSFTPSRNLSATGNLFWNNSAGQQGGALVWSGEAGARIVSSTFVGNTAPVGAGVLALFFGTIDRTIIAFSSGGSAVACDNAQFVPNVLCSDFFGNSGGDWVGCIAGELGVDGNIAADPQFCDATNGDFHLLATSPCAPAQSGTCGLIGAFDLGCATNPVSEPAPVSSLRLLEPNTPNPFGPATELAYTLPAPGPVRLAIFDATGRELAILRNGVEHPGRGTATWNGRDATGRFLPSGIYFVRLEYGGQRETQKIVLAR